MFGRMDACELCSSMTPVFVSRQRRFHGPALEILHALHTHAAG